MERHLVIFLLLFPAIYGNSCVTYNFEDGFESFDPSLGPICENINDWLLRPYSSVNNVARPDLLSEMHITSVAPESCMSSFLFDIEDGGMVEVTVFMTFNEHLTINVHNEDHEEISHWTTLANPIIANSWQTVRFTVTTDEPFRGYISIFAIVTVSSTVLIDSFRYIPPNFDENDSECSIYYDNVEQPTESITTENGFTTELITTFEVITEEVMTEEIITEDVMTEEVTTEEVITEDVKTEVVTTENDTTEDVITEDVTNEDVTAEDVSTEDVTTEDVTAEDVKTEDVTTEEVTTEEVTTDEVTAEEVATDAVTTEEVITEEVTTEEVTTENDGTTEVITTNNDSTTEDDGRTEENIDKDVTTEITTEQDTVTDALTTDNDSTTEPVPTESDTTVGNSTNQTTEETNFNSNEEDTTTNGYTTDLNSGEETTDGSEEITDDSSSFWTPLTISLVVIGAFTFLILLCYISYRCGKSREKKKIPEILYLDIEEIPKTVVVPRVKKVYSESVTSSNPYAREYY